LLLNSLLPRNLLPWRLLVAELVLMEVEELPEILLQLAETGEKFAYAVYHSAVEGRRALRLLLLSHCSGHI
jgi:hypothetical protein